jgi:hypothetical protein
MKLSLRQLRDIVDGIRNILWLDIESNREFVTGHGSVKRQWGKTRAAKLTSRTGRPGAGKISCFPG